MSVLLRGPIRAAAGTLLTRPLRITFKRQLVIREHLLVLLLRPVSDDFFRGPALFEVDFVDHLGCRVVDVRELGSLCDVHTIFMNETNEHLALIIRHWIVLLWHRSNDGGEYVLLIINVSLADLFWTSFTLAEIVP